MYTDAFNLISSGGTISMFRLLKNFFGFGTDFTGEVPPPASNLFCNPSDSVSNENGSFDGVGCEVLRLL
jgi:hypothetical protein